MKTDWELGLLNNPDDEYFIIPNAGLNPTDGYSEKTNPAVALSTNNYNGSQLFSSFILSPASLANLSLGLKTIDWTSNTGYKPSPTGIAENINEGTFSIFPNPFGTGFQIKATANTNQHFQIAVFNILGQKVYQAKGNLDKINNGLQSIGKTLHSGTYFLELKGAEGSTFRKEAVKW